MKTDAIDFLSIVRLLKKRIWLLLIFTGLGLLLSGIMTSVFIPTQYSANVLLYIWQDKKGSTSNSLTSSDLALFSQLVDDYKVLMKSRLVTDQVAKELNLTPEQSSELSDKITVENKANTRYLVITVLENDSKLAATVANTVADVFANTVVKKMGVVNVQIIDPAIEPASPSAPNIKLNLVTGALCGLLLSAGLVIIADLFDTTVRTANNIVDLTGFTLLGSIPEFENTTIVEKGRRSK